MMMEKSETKMWLQKAETLELDDAAREKAQGSFIDLPAGNTHYELKGEGKLVVLVHGYSTPYFIYDKLFHRFVADGYKVLRYDLFGRGMSERVKGDYNTALFSRQLEQLTEAVVPGERFILVGTSMGGSITTAFVKRHPDKVEKLILLAPAGMDSFKAPFYMRMCKIPGFGKWIFSIIGAKSLLNGCAREIIYAKDEVEKGVQMSDPLRKSGLFPVMICHMTKIGEELKNKYSFIRRVDPHYAISFGPDTENELD